MTDYSGQRWGVDCSCLMYKARGSGLSAMTVVASLLVRLRRANINTVFVFDGRPPTAKAIVVEQRRVVRTAVHKEMVEIQAGLEAKDLTVTEKAEMEHRHALLQKKAPTVTHGDKEEIKRLLYGAGIQFITASGEADDVLALLCRNGTLQGIITSDTDMLARGVPSIVIPETADATVLTEIRLNDVLSGLHLTYPQFVDACMLMGSDYSVKNWKPVEPKNAVEMAKKGVDWSALDPSGEMVAGGMLLRGDGVEWEAVVNEKQRAKWLLGSPPCEPETINSLATANSWPMDWIGFLRGEPGFP